MVLVALDEQSKDIAMGVDNGYEIEEHEPSDDELNKIGARDQGMDVWIPEQTDMLIPYLFILHIKCQGSWRRSENPNELDYLGPDGRDNR